MANTAITAQIHQPLDVHGHFTAQIAFDHVVLVDDLTDLDDFLIRQFRNPALPRDADFGTDLRGFGPANAMDVSQRNLDPFVGRNIYACYPRHPESPRLRINWPLNRAAVQTVFVQPAPWSCRT
jgi:hypothetical protein